MLLLRDSLCISHGKLLLARVNSFAEAIPGTYGAEVSTTIDNGRDSSSILLRWVEWIELVSVAPLEKILFVQIEMLG